MAMEISDVKENQYEGSRVQGSAFRVKKLSAVSDKRSNIVIGYDDLLKPLGMGFTHKPLNPEPLNPIRFFLDLNRR